MGEERRLHMRVPRALPVRLTFKGTDDFLRAYTENISLGGVFVPTNANVPVGTKVDLTIELTPGKGFQVDAEVAWSRPAVAGGAPAGVGLRFVTLRPKHELWLREAVQNYQAQRGPPEERLEPAHQLRSPLAGPQLAAGTLVVDELNLDSKENDPIIGIDLGTSNTAACTMDGGKAVIIDLNEEGMYSESKAIPSVVAYNDAGDVTIGHRAIEQIVTNAKRTIFGSKRFVGRIWDHPDVQAMLPRYPYKVVPGPERRAAVDVNGKVISLPAVSGKILGHVRQMAEKRLRVPVHRAIITVPAYYNQNQRDAVIQAGRLAGLTVERILNEPTAAAIAYGLTFTTPRTIMVYDLGGGTFDIAVMKVGDKRLEVIATAGDTFLGGEDFDNVIVQHVLDRYEKQTQQKLSRNHSALARLKVAAEKTKRRLTTHASTMFAVRDAVLPDGKSTRIELELTRQEVERLVDPLVQRTLKICDLALEEAHMRRDQVDDVILVGGQTLMPLVQNRVGEHFGKKPRYDLRADEVVAMGAGMLTALSKEEQSERLSDVLSMSIGIGLPGGRFKKLIERNHPVPCRVSHNIEVPSKQLRGYAIEVYQGEAPEIVRNEHLGALKLGGLAPGRADPVKLRIDFILSPDCLLKVSVTNLDNGQETDVLLDTRDSPRG
jgi:molecular chaperone DnaK